MEFCRTTYDDPLELHVRSHWKPAQYQESRRRIVEHILGLLTEGGAPR